MTIIKQSRSVDWTTERINALATLEVKQLRANAERLNDPEIVDRCNAVLGERPRSGVPKPGSTTRRRTKKKRRGAGRCCMSIPVRARSRFMVGKYEVIAEPLQYSTHMLRYNVYVGKTRIGATVSIPSESDCLFLEKPPIVPPLKIYNVTGRPGRPKKGATKPAIVLERDQPGFREALPSDVSLDGLGKSDDR